MSVESWRIRNLVRVSGDPNQSGCARRGSRNSTAPGTLQQVRFTLQSHAELRAHRAGAAVATRQVGGAQKRWTSRLGCERTVTPGWSCASDSAAALRIDLSSGSSVYGEMSLYGSSGSVLSLRAAIRLCGGDRRIGMADQRQLDRGERDKHVQGRANSDPAVLHRLPALRDQCLLDDPGQPPSNASLVRKVSGGPTGISRLSKSSGSVHQRLAIG
jgi:hypothetical protein